MKMMQHITSNDGTAIAYEKVGKGPALILIGGALNDHKAVASGMPLAKRLAANFTVYSYDRRGRGASGDTKPYAIEREVEDIAALIQNAGGSAYAYGMSSGGALALEATHTLVRGLPNARQQLLDGQSHNVKPGALAPALTTFFSES
jgi:pimeloyl-ACP methyl ester carboxylesterase